MLLDRLKILGAEREDKIATAEALRDWQIKSAQNLCDYTKFAAVKVFEVGRESGRAASVARVLGCEPWLMASVPHGPLQDEVRMLKSQMVDVLQEKIKALQEAQDGIDDGTAPLFPLCREVEGAARPTRARTPRRAAVPPRPSE